MNETTKTILLALIGWAIYRHLTKKPLLPAFLAPTTPALPSGEAASEEEWEIIRADGGIMKVIHRWR